MELAEEPDRLPIAKKSYEGSATESAATARIAVEKKRVDVHGSLGEVEESQEAKFRSGACL